MDIFAHFLWTYVIFHKTQNPLLAGLFGVLPDLLSFGILFMTNMFSKKKFPRGPPDPKLVPSYVKQSYNYTHSLIIFLIISLIIYLITKNIYVFLFGWPLHILIDIPTHTSKFFPTPFLFPLSKYRFNGIRWSNKIFMIINYSSLIIVYILMFAKVL